MRDRVRTLKTFQQKVPSCFRGTWNNKLWRGGEDALPNDLRGLPLLQRNPLSIPGADVFGLRADDAALRSLFEDVRDPAGHAAHGKRRRE